MADVFPGSSQVGLLGLADADDRTIWEYARANGFVFVTQDSDYADLATLYGPPPKVIWLRCGNQPTDAAPTPRSKGCNRGGRGIMSCPTGGGALI